MQKKPIKIIKPKFNNAALNERQSIPTPKLTQKIVSFYQRKELMTSPAAKETSGKKSSKLRSESSQKQLSMKDSRLRNQ